MGSNTSANSSSCFSESSQDTRIHDLHELQEALASLTPDNYSKLIDMINELGFTHAPRLPSLVRSLYRISALRYHSVPLYIKLVDDLVNHCQICQAIHSQLYFGYKVDAIPFISELINHCYITNDEAAKIKRKLNHNYKRREFEIPHKNLIEAIQTDYLDYIQKISKLPEFNANLRLDLPPCSDQLLKQRPSLVQYAAYCGSLLVLKYLMSIEADISLQFNDFSIVNYAFAGGNYEIIQIIENEGYSTDGKDILHVIRHHRTDLFNWILQLFPNALDDEAMDACVTYEYMHGMIHNENANPQKVFEIACANNMTEIIEFMANKYQLNTSIGLHKAVINGCNEAVQLFFSDPKIHACINKKEAHIPLIDACKYVHVDIAKLFLNLPGISVNRPNSSGITALIAACRSGFPEIVQLLLNKKGIDANAKGEGCSALGEACKGGHLEIVKLLLKVPGIDANISPHGEYVGYGETFPLLEACTGGYAEIVELLLKQHKIDINKIASGKTPLSEAIKGGYIKIVKMLLNIPSIDVNHRAHGEVYGDSGSTPLIQACSKGNEEIVKLLLNFQDIDVNLSTSTTPLIEAVKGNHRKVVELLLNRIEIDVNKQVGTFPLYEACKNGNAEIVNMLLLMPKIDLNKKNRSDGLTPMMLVKKNKNNEVIKLLKSMSNTDHDSIKNKRYPVGLMD